MSEVITLTSSAHAHFDDVAALMIALSSLNTAITSYSNGGIFPEAKNPLNGMILPGFSARYSFQSHALMQGLTDGKWPNKLQLVRDEPDTPYRQYENMKRLTISGLEKMVGQLMGNTFLKFYELHVRQWKSTLGSNPKQWPDTWRFAWHIRNAVGHGGHFKIDDASTASCTWRMFTVTHCHNGRRWFDMDGGMLGAGDVFELMNELHNG